MASELRKIIHIERAEIVYRIGDGEETFTATFRDMSARSKRESPFTKGNHIEEEWVLSSPVTADELILLSHFNELLVQIKEGQKYDRTFHSEE